MEKEGRLSHILMLKNRDRYAEVSLTHQKQLHLLSLASSQSNV
jgi:hypothetical protein